MYQDNKPVPNIDRVWTLEEWQGSRSRPTVFPRLRPGQYPGQLEAIIGGPPRVNQFQSRPGGFNGPRFQQPGTSRQGQSNALWSCKGQWNNNYQQPGTSKGQPQQQPKDQQQPWWVKAAQKQQQQPWTRWSRGGRGGRGRGQQAGQQRPMAGQRWGGGRQRTNDELQADALHEAFGGCDEDEDYNEDMDFGQGPGGDGDANMLAEWRGYGQTKRNKFQEAYKDNVEFHKFVVELCRRHPYQMMEFRSILTEKAPEPGGSFGQPFPEKDPFQIIEEEVGDLMDQLMFGPPDDPLKTLFKGVCIYVNGYTYPTAGELQELMQLSGGEFTWSFQPKKTTHTIATVLSQAQKKREKARLTTVRPDWILDSLKMKKLQPVHEYKVIKPKNDIKKMFQRIFARQEEERKRAARRARGEPSPEPEPAPEPAPKPVPVVKPIIRTSYGFSSSSSSSSSPPSPCNPLCTPSPASSPTPESQYYPCPQLMSLYTDSELEELFAPFNKKGKGLAQGSEPKTSTPTRVPRVSMKPPTPPPRKAKVPPDPPPSPPPPSTPPRPSCPHSPELLFLFDDYSPIQANPPPPNRDPSPTREPPPAGSLTPEMDLDPVLLGYDSPREELIPSPDLFDDEYSFDDRCYQIPVKKPKVVPEIITTTTRTTNPWDLPLTMASLTITRTEPLKRIPPTVISRTTSTLTRPTASTSTTTTAGTSEPGVTKPGTSRTGTSRPEATKTGTSKVGTRILPTVTTSNITRTTTTDPLKPTAISRTTSTNLTRPTTSTITRPTTTITNPLKPITTPRTTLRTNLRTTSNLTRSTSTLTRTTVPGMNRILPKVTSTITRPITTTTNPIRPITRFPTRTTTSTINSTTTTTTTNPEPARKRNFQKKQPDDRHYVEVESYIPSTMTELDEAMLAELPDDIRREITGYIRQKAGNVGKAPGRTIPGNIMIVKAGDPTAGSNIPIDRNVGTSRAGTSRTGTSRPEATKPGSSKPGTSKPGMSKTGTSKAGTSRSKVTEPATSKPETTKRTGPGIFEIFKTRPKVTQTGTSKTVTSKPATTKPKTTTTRKNTRKRPPDPPPPPPSKQTSKHPIFASPRVAGPNQLRLDTMFMRANIKAKILAQTPEELAMAIYFGRKDEQLGPNLCGQTQPVKVMGIVRQWILTEPDLMDDDLTYLLKYFSMCIDGGKHAQLLSLLWKMKSWILMREAKGGLECATWKTLFFETFPAFLGQEPDLKGKISRKLFWYAKERPDGDGDDGKQKGPRKRAKKS